MLGDDIVASARRWKGTRFQHQGRIKRNGRNKGGCDCLGLLMGIAHELSLHSPRTGKMLIEYDERSYPHQPDTQMLRAVLDEALYAVELDGLMAGDIVLCSIDGQPQHLGVIGNCAEGLTLIHAYAQARSVVEHRLDALWINRIVAGFRAQVN